MNSIKSELRCKLINEIYDEASGKKSCKALRVN